MVKGFGAGSIKYRIPDAVNDACQIRMELRARVVETEGATSAGFGILCKMGCR